MKLKFTLLSILFIVGSKSFADCPHCFTLANVKITTTSGSVSGFMPLHGEIFYDFEKDSVSIGDDIVEYAKNQYKEFQFVDSLVNLPVIGSSIINENIRQFSLSSVLSIHLLKYTKHGGAGSLTGISLKDYNLLTQSKIVSYELISGNVCDDLYINVSPELDSTDFHLLMDFLYSRENYISGFSELSKFARDTIYNHYVFTEIKRIHKEIIGGLTNDVEVIQNEFSDSLLTTYFNLLTEYRSFQIDFFEAVAIYFGYVELNDSKPVLEQFQNHKFFSRQKGNVERFKKLVTNEEITPFKKYYSLLSLFDNINNPNQLEMRNVFSQISNRYNFIKYQQCFD
ncbi:MAG: hypothetical protein ABJG78_03555 [Cyclobacteriaceae bacterium]